MKYYRDKDGYNGINGNWYQSNHDLIAKFRLFDDTNAASAKGDLEDYLDVYTSGPLTKAELLNRMADNLPVDPNFASKWKIKRMGKDKNDIFWAFGKIHGLENIAYLSEEEILETKGDPFKIQMLVDKINDSEKPLPPPTHDAVVNSLQGALEDYKNVMMAINSDKQMLESDKKRILSLPFYLSKRAELPEPKMG